MELQVSRTQATFLQVLLRKSVEDGGIGSNLLASIEEQIEEYDAAQGLARPWLGDEEGHSWQ